MPPAALKLVHSAEQATALLADLVGIDSVNPDLVPGSAGEAQIAAYVAAWLGDVGLDVELVEPRPGRPSVVAIARGTGGGRSLMLNAHIDTVGVAGMKAPHEPLVRDGRLYGRGAYDMKGGLAACMLAGAAAARGELAGDVLVTAVSDEEHASLGTQAVLERFRTDAAIVTEPTAMKVCVAHKGFTWLRVTARGRAAHGSRPDLGADAIAHVGLVLAQLRDLDRSLRAGTHPLLGGGSVHASMITGGQELSSYPELCVLDIERRTVPGEDAVQVRDQIEALLEGVRTVEPDALLEAHVTLIREPFEVDQEEPIVQAVVRAAHEVTGATPQVVGDSPWMDAALIAAAGIPTVVFGPAGAGAHAAVEWADLGSVVDCAQALTCVRTRTVLMSRTANPPAAYLMANPNRRPVSVAAPDTTAATFHRRIPGFTATRLHQSPTLAARLGVGSVWLKDDGERLGLPSFKALGATWAVARLLADRFGMATPELSIDALRDRLAGARAPTLVAATDGNHGRAVARTARLLGLAAIILVPEATAAARIDAIRSEGGDVRIVGGDYDAAVRAAARMADEGHLVVADTSWPGYEQIPKWVVEGYSTIFTELDEQLASEGAEGPDLLVVPVGVGSLAAAALAHLRSRPCPDATRLLTVEPHGASCLLASLEAGRPVTLSGVHESIMAGLNRNSPSPLTWPLLRDGVDAACSINDADSVAGMRLLAAADIDAGACAGATVGALIALLDGPRAAAHRATLGLHERSTIACLLTERPTDPLRDRELMAAAA